MPDSQNTDEFGRIPNNPEAPRGPQPPMPPHPAGPSDSPDTNTPKPVEVVEQLKDSEMSDSGPNEVLRGHIELFSKYSPVFKSLGHTIFGAAIIPFAIAFFVFQLSPDYEVTKLSGAILKSARELWGPLFLALYIARSLKAGGLAEKHFRWSPILCTGLLKTFELIVWAWLPLRFVYTALITFESGEFNDSLGRLLFIAAMAAMTVGLYRTSRALQKWHHDSDSTPKPRFIQDTMMWFLPLMSASLVVMSIMGYHFTAVQMSQRALWTILLMTGIGMVGGLISRLLLIAQFGIKLRQLCRNDEGEIRSGESIDISAISQQVNRLLRATALVGMLMVGWQIWANVLPVFGYLNDWHVYQTERTGNLEWVSVGHLLMAAGTVFITFVLSNNLPGLLEITLLDRLPLDRGGRYAISFVVKYLVFIFGLLAACSIIGFSWSKVQWLAAGLTVGLGFGLQEIFANVISGIIILIERPIRVGDVVTVDGTTGTVTRMQLRATTVMDRDYRELIVPNKKFITENVMNWTLTDLTSRISFKVGVAYASDTQLVNNTLLKIAKRHPLINESPAPEVVFESFGDSTLNFELRVFIPNREVYSKVLHELNMAINSEFAKKEIEIAFPQQDIFIKNIDELPVSDPSSGQPTGGHPGEAIPGGAATSGQGTGSVSTEQLSTPSTMQQQGRGDSPLSSLGESTWQFDSEAQRRAASNQMQQPPPVPVTRPVQTAQRPVQQSPHSDRPIDSAQQPTGTAEQDTAQARVIPFRLRDVRVDGKMVRSDRLKDAA